ATLSRVLISTTCLSHARVLAARRVESAAAADATDASAASNRSALRRVPAHSRGALPCRRTCSGRRPAAGSRGRALPPLRGRWYHGPGTLDPGAEEGRRSLLDRRQLL